MSEDPSARNGTGGGSSDAGGSGGSLDSTAATGGTTATGGGESGSGGGSTGGSSGTGGGSTGGNSGTGETRGGNAGTAGSTPPAGRPDGAACGHDDECESTHCTDGVCCNEECDGACERCDAGEELGTCALAEVDDACSAPYQCTARNRCRLPDGEACGDDDECDSDHCAPTKSGTTVCCASACGDDACEACGSDGTCGDHPPSDERCPPVTCQPDTRCVEYRPPTANACSGHGECAACAPVYTRAGVPCGVGSECDGAGACEVTGRGRFAAGEQHTCAINDRANVVCWGDNRFGQLGAVFNRQRVGLEEPPLLVAQRELDFPRDVVQITAGAQHTCVLFDDGGVRCWGTLWNHPTFGRITSFLGTLDVTFVLGSQTLAPPWGFIDPLQTGNVVLAEPAEQLSAAPEGATICAVLRSGRISCWGLNANGQLGLGHRDQLVLAHFEYLPSLDLGERAIEVRSGLGHTCALSETGRVHCWGEGIYGRLGSGSGEPRYSPSGPVEIGEAAVGLAVGFDHNCVLLARGAVRCWGNNHQGQLGYGHTLAIGDDETPAAAAMLAGPGGRARLGGDVALGTEVTQVVTFPAKSAPASTGVWDSSSTCALGRTNRLVRCWGRNEAGQLGYGHDLPGATEYTPVELGELRAGDRFVDAGGEILALAEGGRCALRRTDDDTTGSLYCWGANDHGQLGVPGNPLPSVTLRPFDLGPVHWWAQ